MSCDMQSLVEARRDGRLGDKESASVERHLQTCDACRAFLADMDVLADLGERAGEMPPLSELEHRRNRLAVLRAAAAPNKAKTPRNPRKASWAAGLAAAAMLAFVVSLLSSNASQLSSIFSLPSIDVPQQIVATVSEAPKANFDRQASPTMERVRLYDGIIDVHVVPLAKGQRFIVATGDAEVEVKGTRFTVRAADDELKEVVVQEGVVEVRIGDGVHLLHAGDSFTAPEKTAMAAATATATPEPAALRPRPGPARTAEPAEQPGAEQPAGEQPEGEQAEDEQAEDEQAEDEQAEDEQAAPKPRELSEASKAFADAVGKMEGGDYRNASKALRDFARDHAADARAEDADFLAIVALQARPPPPPRRRRGGSAGVLGEVSAGCATCPGEGDRRAWEVRGFRF